MKRCSTVKSRLTTPLSYSNFNRKPPTHSSTLHKRIEQLENDLAHLREDNKHLHQRLTTTLSRINILKTTNQVCYLFLLLF